MASSPEQASSPSTIEQRRKEIEDREQDVAEQLAKAYISSDSSPKHSDAAAAKFRGTWNYVITDRPAFNAYSFLPTPPAVKPRGQDKAAVEEEDEGELRHEPPDDAEVFITVKDRFGDYRGYIAEDGECVNNRDKTIGYINREDYTAGSREEEYLGCLQDQISGDECVVEDAMDERCGMVHLGHATIKDNQGSTVAEIHGNGIVVGNQGSQLGEFEGFTFNEIRTVGLYMMLIDPGMLNEIEG